MRFCFCFHCLSAPPKLHPVCKITFFLFFSSVSLHVFIDTFQSSSILPRVNGGYKSGGAMLNGRIGGGVRGMNSAKRSSKGAAAATTTIPFHDYSSSDDEELLRKPYTDEVAS